MAKFFMKHAINIDAVARTLKPLWRTKQDFEIQDMGNHILLFVFSGHGYGEGANGTVPES